MEIRGTAGEILRVFGVFIFLTPFASSGNESQAASWPREWYEPPKTASQIGLMAFSESPILQNRDLPPVHERLPDDPVVVYPLQEVGGYGGTARITSRDEGTFMNYEHLLTISADLKTFLPNLAESWSVSEDGRVISITLRSGIRWSDGVPLTSDDFEFTFTDLWMNEEFTPVTSRWAEGGTFVKVDERSFRYEFEQPNPTWINILAQYGNFLIDPKHFYSQFHPDYVNREELETRIQEMGFVSWMNFVSDCRANRLEESALAPTLRAYQITKRTPTLIRFERNPYYFKVDPEGQQLPYIDAVDAEVILKNEVTTAKASTGQLDFASFDLRTQDIPLLKLGERTGTNRVYIWSRLHGSDVVIQPNYNHEDKTLAALFWEKRFRHALSYAINRDEMNEIIYFGRGVPRQVTVHPSSSYYDDAFASAHIDYRPDYARELLDELGLKDVDGDGLREYPDGADLTITLEFLDFETPKAISLELVTQYWREVGVDVRLKLVDANLQRARAMAGEMQMTAWHADRSTDILFPVSPSWWVPREINWHTSMWNDWARWYITRGRLGKKPPPEIEDLQRWADGMLFTTDHEKRVEFGRKILASSAENLWSIGTVGLAPHPMAVSRRLKNVPEVAIWGWDNRWTLAYHPATWYFAE